MLVTRGHFGRNGRLSLFSAVDSLVVVMGLPIRDAALAAPRRLRRQGAEIPGAMRW